MNRYEKHWTQLTDRDLCPWLPDGEKLRGCWMLATVLSPSGGMEMSAGGRVDYVLPVLNHKDEPAVHLGGTAGTFPPAPTGAWNEVRTITPLDRRISVLVTRDALANAEFYKSAWWVAVDDSCSLALSRELLVDRDA